MSSFYISGKSYEANDEDLQRYCVDIKLASDELATSQSIKFNYIEPLEMKNGKTYFRTHQTNIETVFKMKSKGKYDNHELSFENTFPLSNFQFHRPPQIFFGQSSNRVSQESAP